MDVQLARQTATRKSY